MINVGINELSFEPKMPVAMDATGETSTPEGLQPRQGSLANLRYKPTYLRYNIRLSAAPTTGAADLILRDSAGTVIQTIALSLNGVTQISGEVAISLSAIPGENKILTAIDVASAFDAGITAQVDSVIAVEIPLTSTGNC